MVKYKYCAEKLYSKSKVGGVDMEIRYVTTMDNHLEISEVHEKSWKYAYKDIIPTDYLDSIPTGHWANSITKVGMHSLVITDEIIGTASFCKSRWKQYDEYGEIVSIYFLPEYMGKGYGRYLLNSCIDELKKVDFIKFYYGFLNKTKEPEDFIKRTDLFVLVIF